MGGFFVVFGVFCLIMWDYFANFNTNGK